MLPPSGALSISDIVYEIHKLVPPYDTNNVSLQQLVNDSYLEDKTKINIGAFYGYSHLTRINISPINGGDGLQANTYGIDFKFTPHRNTHPGYTIRYNINVGSAAGNYSIDLPANATEVIAYHLINKAADAYTLRVSVTFDETIDNYTLGAPSYQEIVIPAADPMDGPILG